MPFDVVQYADVNAAAYIADLRALLQIPSISTQPEHKKDILAAANWLASELKTIGMTDVQLLAAGGNPVVYGSWLEAGPEAKTLLIYGHYDVQPVGPLSAWTYPPFGAEDHNSRIYARGASDNKAQLMTHVKTVAAYLSAHGRLPLNIKFIFDGEEEIGSPYLADFAAQYKHLLAADLLLISDGAMFDYEYPSIDYGLRGFLALELLFESLPRNLHSGSYGGSVHNPAQALATFLAKLHDDKGRVALPGFYDNVTPLTADERDLLAAVPYDEARWALETGALASWGDSDYSLLERIVARPTCEINGLTSGYQGLGISTIVPAWARAKLSFRLVPNQDPDRVFKLFQTFLAEQAPASIATTARYQAGERAAVTPWSSTAVRIARKVLTEVWRREPIVSRGGGSLPVVSILQRELGLPFILIPLGLDDNRHGPNEHYHLINWHYGIAVAAHFYHQFAEAKI